MEEWSILAIVGELMKFLRDRFMKVVRREWVVSELYILRYHRKALGVKAIFP